VSFAPIRPALAQEATSAQQIPDPAAPETPEAKTADPTLVDLGVDDAGIEAPGLGSWALDTAVISTVTWGATLGLNKNIRDGVTGSSSEQWGDNLNHWPQWKDDSDAVTNYVAHPLLGASWFMAYRSRGHGFVASSLGLIFQSFFLEYVIESPHNIPSAHDLVITPLIGIPIGYGLDTLSVYLLSMKDSRWRYLGYVANPFHLLPSAKKYRWDVAVDPAKKSFAISGRF
jgi:hypothetical protein